jgi:DNA/RNA-binding protein KIN17
MIQFNEDPEFFISRFSKDVKEKFLEIFRVKYGYNGFIPINKAYNEYIKDPYHTHLNSTKWANLSEFAISLQSEGLVDMVKEQDMNGVEQVMIRLIDADKDKKEKLKAVMTKEDVREVERKREIKDIEKTIKLANKMMASTQP